MSCCGQRRQQWQQEIIQTETVPVSTEPVLENPVPVQYHGRSSVMVKGSHTGVLYLFAPGEMGLMIDNRDIDQIMMDTEKFSLATVSL